MAQADHGFVWPWGNEDPDETKMPKFTTGRVMPPPDDVDAHPRVNTFIENLISK